MTEALLTTDLGSLPLLARGKVRDIYAVSEAPDAELVLIATDRISAFDHVLGSGIPDKGKILTQISLFWFEFLKSVVPNHLVTAEVSEFPAVLQPYAEQLRGRTMLVKRARMFPVECVARGYLSGSGWKDYKADRAICGIPLPPGLMESDMLPEPIFTPAAKINTGGHDENISFGKMIETIGEEYARSLRTLTLEIYAKASRHAESGGVILADTKFEFGLVDGVITLADEVLTPDSSRYWPEEEYSPGGPTPSFDKQYVRDYLESIRWNKQAPAPALPDEVVARTREKYMQAFRAITGRAEL
jgi:phosphoribosylaminoimidazole-succinocarboxamide synthase